MKLVAFLLASLFSAAPSIAVLAAPVAGDCDTEISWDPTAGKWFFECGGTCPGTQTCDSFQAGNPMDQLVPLACKCSGSTTLAECAGYAWVLIGTDGAAVVQAGCHTPNDVCGVGGGQRCQDQAAPSVPDIGPVPLWDPCICN